MCHLDLTMLRLLHMDVDEDLVKIIYDELGENTAELFVKFYRGFQKEEQIEGAREILGIIVGESRTNDLLKKIVNKK